MDIYKLLKKPFFARYQVQWEWPVELDKQSQWQKITFVSQSGAEITGLYGQATTNVAKAGIVCAHPMGATAKGFYLKQGHGDMLRRNGYNVLLFDFNGFGESMNRDFNYPLEALAAGKKLREICPSLPIGFLGISFGAAWGICAFANEKHDFEAAVLECPFTTLEEYWYQYRSAYLTLKLMSIVMPRLAEALRPIAQISKVKKVKSILFIYGDKDIKTPQEMGYRLKSKSNIPVNLWIMPNVKHTMGLTTAPEDYESRVIGFFDNTFTGAAQ